MDEILPFAEERRKRGADRAVADRKSAPRAGERPSGYHVGVLAGMGGEEREAAVQAHISAEGGGDLPIDFGEYLDDATTEGPVRRDMAGLIATEPDEELRHWAWAHDLPHGPSLTKAALAEGLLSELPVSEMFPTVMLQGFTPSEFDRFRRLYEEGGVRRLKVADIATLAQVPPVFPLLCYQFREGDSFVYVIPEEAMGPLSGVDWDDCECVVRDYRRSTDIVDALTALRGIVTFGEAYEEFKRCYPDAFDAVDFGVGVRCGLDDGYAAYDLLDTGEEQYLLHFELGNQFRYENGIEEGLFADPYLEGELGSLEAFCSGHRGKPARPLDEGMRTASEVFSWKSGLSCVRALRDCLDRHVPDDADDYFFADSVVDDLIDVMSLGYRDADMESLYRDIFDGYGFVPDGALSREVNGLLANMADSIPTWMNNGWAQRELYEAVSGKKVFYSEDGSAMKVGRNDPCPCGSGKKYKKCCGR